MTTQRINLDDLQYLFLGFFGQGMDFTKPSPDELLSRYIQVVDPVRRRASASQLEYVLTTYASNPDNLEELIVGELRCNYRPEASGKTLEQWLRHVLAKIEQSLEAAPI